MRQRPMILGTNNSSLRKTGVTCARLILKMLMRYLMESQPFFWQLWPTATCGRQPYVFRQTISISCSSSCRKLLCFKYFKQSVTLNTIYCQTGQSEQVAFRKTLLRLLLLQKTLNSSLAASGTIWLQNRELNLTMSFISSLHGLLFWSLTVGD